MQLEHPGVTVLWAGAAAFHWRYPEYAVEAPGEWRDIGEIEGFLRARSRSPLELLVAGRAVLVLANVALLGVALWMAVRLVGAPGAGLTFLLLAFDPLHVGLSRLFQPDGLLASAMFLSLVALLVYLERGGHVPDLIVAGAAAGLAGLTKLPGLVLLPVGATLLVLCVPGPARSRPRHLLARLGAPAVFCATAMAVSRGCGPRCGTSPTVCGLSWASCSSISNGVTSCRSTSWATC
jgi:hypothetical protein